MKKRLYVSTALVRLIDRAAKPGCRISGNARSFIGASQRVKYKLLQNYGALAVRKHSGRLLWWTTTMSVRPGENYR
jgi:hypothetical protein